MDLRSKSRKRDVVSFAQAYGWRSDAACRLGLRSKSRMRDVVRRAAPPFPAVLNKFIFKGSRGEYVSLLPQEPENVLRPGLICRRQQIDKSTKFGLPWPTRSHPPAPPQPRARRTRLRRCPSQVLSGVLNFLSPAGAGRGAVLNSSFGVLLRGTA